MRIIKDCLPVILCPLTDIINNSFTTSTFPESWKIAEIIPLLKEGDHEVASNKRPLSMLKVLSKVCEKVALKQFSGFLNRTGKYDHVTPALRAIRWLPVEGHLKYREALIAYTNV
jgi:hypothetical protein